MSERRLPLVSDPAPQLSRRGFLMGAGTAAVSWLMGCTTKQREEFFQKHFKELTKDEIAERLERMRADQKERFGADVTVKGTPAREGVLFGYALDVGACVGCRYCVYACEKENNCSRDPQIQYIRVLEMERGKPIDIDKANAYYETKTVPDPDKFYLPVACQQCENPPCVKACPVEATWREKDGIVAIDYDWCVGCRCCMSACPYGARHFNWTSPNLGREEINPDQHALGNRPRPKGVVEKCNFCMHRVREGRLPACQEVCPTGARHFGNLLDPESEISKILKTKRVFVLKGELGTNPKFFYYFG
jgi:molybdopterin-containing oxidoreductase family iron-sulfur binding subunit